MRLRLLPVTTGFAMATVSHGLCARRSEAGDPAGLCFSVTHNINHFIQVGQTVLEIHLKCAGTARAGGRRHAWELLTKRLQAAGSCWELHSTETSTVMFSSQTLRTSDQFHYRELNYSVQEQGENLICTHDLDISMWPALVPHMNKNSNVNFI